MAQTTLRDRIQSIEDAISAGQIDNAMADCQQILTYYPDALEMQRLLGEVYLAQGRLDEAQQTFDWILVNDPENVIAYCDRALVCEHLSDIDTALDCYQQAYELSRGNSQIRQGFNQLSAKAGQQEFMLSRAGLARLYMRGDLLTQAMQEWEVVLSSSPDRLDARLGLMETCWREGIYDQVEQMASRMLEEIPNCEKALLLLAHVTSAFNIQRSRELVQRAELLDPELAMAQELFGDLAASQPNDPFLPLVRREPIVLQEQANGNGNGKQIEAINTLPYAAVELKDTAIAGQGTSADRLYNWNAQDSLSELETGSIPLLSTQSAPAQDGPARATGSDVTNIQHVDTRANQSDQNQLGDDFEAWAAQQDIDDDYDPALLEQQPWYQAEQSTTASSSNEQAQADSQPDLSTANDPWNAPLPSHEEEVPAPPAWLDMLTRNERRQPEQTVASTPRIQEPAHNASQLQAEATTAPPYIFAANDIDEDMGWPEWLKSLGAEAIEPAPEPEAQAQLPNSTWNDPQLSAPTMKPNPLRSAEAISHDPWAIQPEEVSFAAQQPAQFSSWEEQIDHTMSEGEKEQLATLETLEQSLLSNGFVPLQPGSLSTIAQESGLATASTPSSSIDAQPGIPIIPAPEMPLNIPGEPIAPPSELLPQETQVTVLATNRVEQAAPETPLISAYRPDTLLENDLETTMRRPAVRLQPMRPGARTDQAYLAGSGRSVPLTPGGKPGAGESSLSNKELLVKGYQYQLAGAYDDAMQVYRIIIRNAPDLLGEVISNVRALLKLAPRYTVGFRVLGDAYMRQGEYLQAMEAYNKALTMAKKAKSQGH
ncbi:MAG TPA: tetratricopeptide repeat protein [Ktedonobacteraceae bacterium]|nr:tetratricopeptide repeat protein [Ktedonobacteraceae bacterium]